MKPYSSYSFDFWNLNLEFYPVRRTFIAVLHQLKHYLLHRFKSFHLHGIHSPFIFQLNRDCLQDRSNYAVYDDIVRFRESVQNNPQDLPIEDHGAGSKRLKPYTRNTVDILKHNCSTLSRTKLLYRLTRYLKADRVLELGTSLGISTHALSIATTTVTSIEASPAVANYAKKQLTGVSNVSIHEGTFQDFFDGKLSHRPAGIYDLVFIDGHHDGKATLSYFNQILPFCEPQTVFIVDDIYWSKDMTTAWHELQLHPKVTASIDTFQWGILFLRKEQNQQGFHIKL